MCKLNIQLIIINFFQEFTVVLCNKILESLQQQTTYKPERWMSDLAIGSIHLKEGNTFARSVWLHLVDKVSNHLAKVIENCDVFSGLDHVIDEKVTWTRSFYIKMMQLVDLNTSLPTEVHFK